MSKQWSNHRLQAHQQEGYSQARDVTGSSFSPATVGNQTVSYAVTNANGCSNTATKTIVVKLCTRY
jgi:hypothetical protein